MKREEAFENQTPLEENAVNETPVRNDSRRPVHVEHELFNENQLLKDILKDCIEEGM